MVLQQDLTNRRLILSHLGEIFQYFYSFLVNCEIEDIETVFELELCIFFHWNGKSFERGHVVVCNSEDHSFVAREMLGRDIGTSADHSASFAVNICLKHLEVV